jgi:hypothetical protein
MTEPEPQKCPACKQATYRYNPVTRRWECVCGHHDR